MRRDWNAPTHKHGGDSRDAAVAELGSSDPKLVSKHLGEKWAAQADRSTWEAQSTKDKARFERENGIYQAALQAEPKDDEYEPLPGREGAAR